VEFLSILWLPILLSAVLVFIVSAILHMVIQHHRSDYKKLDKEDAVLKAMRDIGVKPGPYLFPCAPSFKEAGTPEMVEKYNAGPCGIMTIVPNGPPKMGKNLVQWFLLSVVISIFVGYLTWATVGRSDNYLAVFRITGTIAVLAYSIGHFHEYIWKWQRLGTTMKFVFDGVVYGLLTAGVFGWLWPGA